MTKMNFSIKKSAYFLFCVLLLSKISFMNVFAQSPKSGGSLRLVAPFGSALKTLDPHLTYRSQDMAVSKAFHRTLYAWNSEQNKPILDLAKYVEISNDGRTFTYSLYDNIYFHNGRKMTADDIIWSYTRVLDPSTSYPGAVVMNGIVGAEEYVNGEASSVSGLKKIDDYTFSITYDGYYDPGVLLFEAITAILPKEEVEKESFLAHPIGLGPFKFNEHVEGSHITGVKFDRYFKEGRPYADEVRYMITSDYSAIDAAFRASEIDASVISGSVYQAYQNDPNLAKGLIEIEELFTRHMGFNTTRAPFDKREVRQAINYAIDRDIIIDKLLKNKAFKATGWLPTASVAFDPNLEPYSYDSEKAKELLEQAGYRDGFEFEAWVTDNVSSLGVLEAMLPYLKNIGIIAKINVVEANVLVDALDKREPDVWFRSSGSGPDPLDALKIFDSRTSSASGNRTGFNDPKFDSMLDSAAAEADPNKRIEILKEANTYIFHEAPVWFHNYNKAVIATQPWIHNVDGNVTEAAILEVDSIWVDESSPTFR